MVQLLVKARADLNTQETYLGGETPLHAAIRDGRTEVVAALLDAGARVDVKEDTEDGSGWTPLHRAAQEGLTAAVEALLASGADPNARDAHNGVPLHLVLTAGWQGLRARLVLFVLFTTVFLDGCGSWQFDNTPWWHWLLLPLIAAAFVAAQVALIALCIWLVRWGMQVTERYRSRTHLRPLAFYVLRGAVGAVLGAVAPAPLIGLPLALGGPLEGTWALVSCGAVLGAGIALFTALRQHKGARS